jgi:hypothetical protein
LSGCGRRDCARLALERPTRLEQLEWPDVRDRRFAAAGGLGNRENPDALPYLDKPIKLQSEHGLPNRGSGNSIGERKLSFRRQALPDSELSVAILAATPFATRSYKRELSALLIARDIAVRTAMQRERVD